MRFLRELDRNLRISVFGFDLMPRIRNFKDLIFFRANEHLVYPHIDELFGERGRNVIDWKLIERHWRDLMQVAISISEGRPWTPATRTTHAP